MPFQSADDALAALRKARQALIEEARDIAVEICQEEGSVHARRVFDEMRERIEQSGQKTYWLGCVFNKKSVFEWTGEWHQVSKYEGSSNFHGPIAIRVWRLKDEVAA